MRTPDLKILSSKAPFGVLLLVFFALFSPALHADDGFSHGSVARNSWRHLLYYSPRWFGHENSLIDSHEFFLAKDGEWNSDHELDAFIEALAHSNPKAEEKDRITCRYPARTNWVRRFRPDVKIPQEECPQFEDWLEVSKAKAVSIIFSSYYINNPSSMMGHTFLRLRRGTADASPLLDKAVNFAASPTTEIPIIYNYLGLTGGFPGVFSLTPYYTKVQEYANAESRDLWEYDLSFTEAETQQMLASLWEVAPQRIDYYFFDENCSEVLLYLLQNARPGLNWSEKLGSFVHPSDTIRIMMDEPGAVDGVVYRPSSRSRYLAQERALNAAEVAVMRDLLKAQRTEVPSFRKLTPDRQAAVIDATLGNIEFTENLYGSKAVTKNKVLYDELLAKRSKLASPPLTKFEAPQDEAPHLGHTGQRLGLGLGESMNAKEALLEWRPGQHDVLSPSIGYPPELSIELGRTKLAIEEGGKAQVRSAELFRILSFNPTRTGRFPWSWQLRLNWEDIGERRLQFLSSFGQAFTLDDRDHYFFTMFDMKFKEEVGHFNVCPGATVGLRWSFAKRLVTFTEANVERCYSNETKPWLGGFTHQWRWSLDKTWEIYLSAQHAAYPKAQEITAGFYRYY